MENNDRKLSGRVVWTQGVSQFGIQSIWLLNSYFLLYFYTDVVQIPAAAATVIMLIARVWDAVNDPMMGILCDKTKSPEGKARFWLKRMLLPAGICIVLSYCCPNLPTAGKVLWVGLTYILQGMALTGVGVPSSTLLVTMTSNRIERVKIAQYSAIANCFATYLIPAYTLPLVNLFGRGNEHRGFTCVAILVGLAYAAAVFLIYWGSQGYDPDTSGAGSLSESGKSGSSQNESSLFLLKTALKNRYCILTCLIYMLYLVLAGIMTSTLVYYFRYNLENDSLMSLYSLILIVASFTTILGMRVICKRFGNSMTCIIGGLICVVGLIPRLFGADHVLPVFAVCIALMGIGSALVANVIRQCIMDATTYGKLQTGTSNESVVMSLFTFSQKFGNAAGTVVASGILAIFHYEAGQEITETIKNIFFAENVIVPFVIALIMIFLLLIVYRMEKQLLVDLEHQKTAESQLS